MKNFILFTALASIFMALPKDEVKAFQQSEIKNASGVRFEIYPVKSSLTNSKECLTYKDECLFPLSKTPAVVIEDFKYQRITGKVPGIKLILNKKNARELNKLTKKYSHSRIALVQDGKVIFTPYIKESISDDQLAMTFKNKESFEAVLKKL